MKEKESLLASSPNLFDLLKEIERFYGGEERKLVAKEDGTFSIFSMNGKKMDGVLVRKEGNRYRFVMT